MPQLFSIQKLQTTFGLGLLSALSFWMMARILTRSPSSTGGIRDAGVNSGRQDLQSLIQHTDIRARKMREKDGGGGEGEKRGGGNAQINVKFKTRKDVEEKYYGYVIFSGSESLLPIDPHSEPTQVLVKKITKKYYSMQ
jgi:hypothetical protein